MSTVRLPTTLQKPPGPTFPSLFAGALRYRPSPSLSSQEPRLLLESLISAGEFTTVFMGRRHADPVSSAIKIYPRGAAQDTRRTCLRVLARSMPLWMAKLPHLFIVGFRFSCVDRHRLFLGMEQAGGGDLYTLIQTHGPQPRAELMCYTGELCLAVGHMHALDLMHRDLKPENVLLGLDGHIKLCDFSAAKRMPGRDGETPPPPGEWSLCGTPEYMAPETLLGHPVCETCDWWSFGCIAVECLTELSIFNSDGGADVQSVVRKILHSPITLPEHAHIGEVESDFLHKLLRRKPEERLGHRGPNGDYEAVLAHPWFDGVTAEALLRKQIQPSWVPAGDFGQAWPAVEDSPWPTTRAARPTSSTTSRTRTSRSSAGRMIPLPNGAARSSSSTTTPLRLRPSSTLWKSALRPPVPSRQRRRRRRPPAFPRAHAPTPRRRPSTKSPGRLLLLLPPPPARHKGGVP